MATPVTSKHLLHLTEEQAKEIYAQGENAVVWALLKLSALANRDAAKEVSKPSSQKAPYEKPSSKKRAKKRGRKPGHKGEHRRPPLVIDRREEHTLGQCPECGGPVSDPRGARRRVIEDLERTTVVTTEHVIHSHYCPRCKKRVEPQVTDALPRNTIGNRALALSSWFHYGLGQTVSEIVSVFDSLFHFPVSEGGLTQQWGRLGEILTPWYDAILQEGRESAVLNVDETGWRVNGRTHWLWCFTTPTLTYYHIDPTRSSDVVVRFLAECFEGTLVSDFYAAYNSFTETRQMCLVHLFRELEKVSKTNHSDQWLRLDANLRRLLKDAIRLPIRMKRNAPNYGHKVSLIKERLNEMIDRHQWQDRDCVRLIKRLRKYREHIFTFLDDPEVPFDNNRAERELRPAVIARKNSFQNTSDQGARTQALLMSIFRTLKLRKRDAIETITDALAAYIATDKLPPLPGPADTTFGPQTSPDPSPKPPG